MPRLNQPDSCPDDAYKIIKDLTSYKPSERPKIVETYKKLETLSSSLNPGSISSGSNHYLPSPSSNAEKTEAKKTENENEKEKEPSYTTSPIGATSLESNSSDSKKS